MSKAWVHGTFMPRSRLPRLVRDILFTITLFSAAVGLYFIHQQSSGSIAPPHQPPENAKTESLHLVENLFLEAKKTHEAMLNRQSASYGSAAATYKRKYSRDPPAGFRAWFDMAKRWNSPIIDDFDDIDLQLLPFRPYLRNGCDQQRYTNDECTNRKIIQLCIQDGEVVQYGWREKWHEETLDHMVGFFKKDLPNICVYINYLDEPRLLLAPAAAKENAASDTQAGFCHALDFTNVGHQNAWSEAVMPCPAGSPARARPLPPGRSRASFMAPSFAANFSSATDICQMNRDSAHGMLRSSENLRVSHDFVPVLSSSKLSTFSDVLLPPLFRFSSARQYDPEKDIPWEEKESKLHWRGSTTGGHGMGNNWKKFHRQHVIKTLTDKHNDAIDVAFTAVTQCEDKACTAQSDYFDLANRTDINENWEYKWILDIDGNGLSGRLYDLLRSQSLVMRYSFSREWHDSRLLAWLHYIPLSQNLGEVNELLEFLSTPRGDEIAREIAMAGREWVDQALRGEDMVIYFFRLLLEMSNGRDIS